MFTKPEGAIANLEFMAKQMTFGDISGLLAVECFDSRGIKHTANSYRDAMDVLSILRGDK